MTGVQTTYRDQQLKGAPGQVAMDRHTEISHGAAPTGARGRVVDLTFAGTPAATNTVTTTFTGVPAIVSTLLADDTTIQAARDRVLRTLLDNQSFQADYVAVPRGADSTSSIRVSPRDATNNYTVTLAAAGGGVTVAQTQVSAAVSASMIEQGQVVTVDDSRTRTAFVLPVKTPASGEEFAGVIRDDDYGEEGIGDSDPVSLVTRGTILGIPEVDVAEGDPVFYRHTANAGLTPGSLRNDSDGGTNAQWTVEATAANSTNYRLAITIADADGNVRTGIVQATSDASATQAEIATALAASVNANDVIDGVVSANAVAANMFVTALAGFNIVSIEDIGAGNFTTLALTTDAVEGNASPMPKAKWLEAGRAGQLTWYRLG